MTTKIITDSSCHSSTFGSSKPKQQQQTLLIQYIKSVSVMNKQTANEYYDRLVKFERFLLSHFGHDINLDKFVEDLI